MEKHETNLLLANALGRLKESGYKRTNARRTILEILCQHDNHLTSTEVLEQVRLVDSSIGRASVFRTLELLTELTIIRPTYLRPGAPHYIIMPSTGHHAHIICPKCNNIIELDDCKIEESLQNIAKKHKVQVSGHLLELYGKCQNCSEFIEGRLIQ